MINSRIAFNRPCVTGKEIEYIKDVIAKGKFSGDNDYTKKCNSWLENKLGCRKALLTTSGTHALDMMAILIGIKPGDEVIMPSFTFSSTANAFVLRGAKIVFVDVNPDTMNIDDTIVEKAITEKTKAIVAVHYAGVPCEMDAIMNLGEKYNLYVLEDAAQAILSKHKGKFAGSIGNMAALSFHETKNIQCGEGGALLINDPDFIERAEIIREKGTDRSKFFRGEIDKYGWVDFGSSYLPGELSAAFLFAQLEIAEEIITNRLESWKAYYKELKSLMIEGMIQLAKIPEHMSPNGHLFYIKTRDLSERTFLQKYLNENNINCVFHYIPLHSSRAGKKYGRFHGDDSFTTLDSERLLRLPMWYGLKSDQISYICEVIKKFYNK